MSEPRVQAVSQITLTGAIHLCEKIAESESERADDFKSIAGWLKECREYKSILNNSAYAEIKVGNWVKLDKLNIYKCDVCDDGVNKPSQFCPHCGSFMNNYEHLTK